MTPRHCELPRAGDPAVVPQRSGQARRPGMPRGSMTPQERYSEIVTAFLRRPGVTQQGRGFWFIGAQDRREDVRYSLLRWRFCRQASPPAGRRVRSRWRGQAIRAWSGAGHEGVARAGRGLPPGLDIAGGRSRGLRWRHAEMSSAVIGVTAWGQTEAHHRCHPAGRRTAPGPDATRPGRRWGGRRTLPAMDRGGQGRGPASR